MRKRGPRPYRYEVDLGMLPEGATAAQLDRFCEVLQRIVDEDDTDLAHVVACFEARNPNPPSGHQLCWGWPTKENWNDAIREVFGSDVTP